MLLERKRKVSTHPSIRIGEDTGVGCGELWKGDDGIVQLEGELMLVGSLVSFRFVSSDGILGCDNG